MTYVASAGTKILPVSNMPCNGSGNSVIHGSHNEVLLML